MKVVPKEETTCKRGAYCILLFSAKKENYLKNIGYLGAQLDLWLASQNIGVCWYGAGKVNETYDTSLEFVSMLAIQKVPENSFRKNMFQSKRKPLSEIWYGTEYLDIADIVRFAPSACNLQPWFVESKKQELAVYKVTQAGKRGIMPANKVSYYSEIDIGIFLLFLEVCLRHQQIAYNRTLYSDYDKQTEKMIIANYQIC